MNGWQKLIIPILSGTLLATGGYLFKTTYINSSAIAILDMRAKVVEDGIKSINSKLDRLDDKIDRLVQRELRKSEDKHGSK